MLNVEICEQMRMAVRHRVAKSRLLPITTFMFLFVISLESNLHEKRQETVGLEISLPAALKFRALVVVLVQRNFGGVLEVKVVICVRCVKNEKWCFR